MHATDTEGQTMINAISDFANSNGYEAYDRVLIHPEQQIIHLLSIT